MPAHLLACVTLHVVVYHAPNLWTRVGIVPKTKDWQPLYNKKKNDLISFFIDDENRLWYIDEMEEWHARGITINEMGKDDSNYNSLIWSISNNML